jgi:predicted ATPase
VFRPQDLTDGSIEAALWPGLIAARRDKLLMQALNDIFATKIEQLQLLPDGRFMLLLPDKGLSLDVFGDGIRAATRCLMVLAAMEDTMLILEEPESHQHPGSLDRFAAALSNLARTQKVQLLLTTHSAECVRAFAKGSAAAGSSFALFHLKLDDGLLWARRFDRDTTETLTASGVDVRFLDLYA